MQRRLEVEAPGSQLVVDPLRTLAYGTDASFYRLIPQIVVKADSEADVRRILAQCSGQRIPVTFRAAGTSLSGQAVTDSVLIVAGGNWNRHEILDEGRKIRLQPGVIGAQANRYLAASGRKIGPDPASINAAMIGGIAANNASGMCCGTDQNSYQTVDSMRIVFADGSLLDTGSTQSRERFSLSNGALLERLAALGKAVRENGPLAERIRRKFKIKNTTGYSLNALVDFTDPFDIINHLMIGSEGTLGFISEIVYQTVVEHAFKASALMVFTNMENACRAAALLKQMPVAAVELMDRAALHSVENKPAMPAYLKSLAPDVAALLVETRAEAADDLKDQVRTLTGAIDDAVLERAISFTDLPDQFNRLWNIRKGLFPAVGAVRKAGTTVIIEDVAFPIVSLAPATLDLRALLDRHRYREAIIFGHALEGNLHFVFTQDFGISAEVDRYQRFIDDVADLVVDRYDGSLKAEHGTGRNMAPFVEKEWGREAYALMREIKQLFDPDGILNPGVILNDNPRVHLENLKPLPETNPLVDKCIECGFCEAACPSRNLTLTPRQRITVQRELSRLRRMDVEHPRRAEVEKAYVYQGDQTCAVDGLCELHCPVDINTGELTKALRHQKVQTRQLQKRADLIAAHYGRVTRLMGTGLKAADSAHRLLGGQTMNRYQQRLRQVLRGRWPQWNPYMPTPVGDGIPQPSRTSGTPVVYFPSCLARTMGPARGDEDALALPRVTVRVLERAGYRVHYPLNMEQLCCGLSFDSKGFKAQADRMAKELELALLAASQGGRWPVLCDTSPCLYRMRNVMDGRLQLYEPMQFLHEFVLPRLTLKRLDAPILLHVTCSSRKMALEPHFMAVAEACAKTVVVPEGIECCGFAGDRGFKTPELNASALEPLRGQVPDGCHGGYTNSRTCEIGLALHSGVYYKSIMYLVERCASGHGSGRTIQP